MDVIQIAVGMHNVDAQYDLWMAVWEQLSFDDEGDLHSPEPTHRNS